MTIHLKKYLSLPITALLLSTSFASGDESTASAYQHYRCDALVQLNQMTDADQLVCDDLKADGFDLATWRVNNPDQATKLHHEVFSEFF